MKAGLRENRRMVLHEHASPEAARPLRAAVKVQAPPRPASRAPWHAARACCAQCPDVRTASSVRITRADTSRTFVGSIYIEENRNAQSRIVLLRCVGELWWNLVELRAFMSMTDDPPGARFPASRLRWSAGLGWQRWVRKGRTMGPVSSRSWGCPAWVGGPSIRLEQHIIQRGVEGFLWHVEIATG